MKYGFMAMVMPMYHFKGFLIGCVYTLIMAVVITGWII